MTGAADGWTPDVPPLGGRWRLGEVLGEGGEGRIFAATRVTDGVPADDGTEYVVKVVWSLTGRAELEKFLKYQDAHLVTYRDHGDLDDPDLVARLGLRTPPGLPVGTAALWIAMSRAEVSLSTLVGERAVSERQVVADRPVGPVEGRAIWAALDGALSYLHGRSAVHGDVKPGNLLRFPDGDGGTVWRLSDYGLAVQVPASRLVVTRKGATLPYESPRARRTGKVGPADDRYAAAIAVHVAATGRDPRVDDRIELDPSLPADLRNALAAALAGGDDTPVTIPREGAATTPVDPPAPVPVPPVGRGRALAVAAGVVVALLLAALGWKLLGPGDDDTAGAGGAKAGSSTTSATGSTGTDGGATTASSAPGGGSDGSIPAGKTDDGVAGGATGRSHVLFVRGTGEQARIVDLDLTDGSQVVVPLEGTEPGSPSRASTGRLAITTLAPEGSVLAVAEPGSEAVRTFRLPGNVASAAISPDGAKVAYVTDSGGDTDVALLDVRSGQRSLLASGSSDERDPSWNAEGTEVAYVEVGSAGDRVVRLEVASGDRQVVADGPGAKRSPSFGPDGRIAFVADADGGRDVFVVAPGGGDPERVAPTPVNELGVAWCDGGLVASSARGGLVRLDPDDGTNRPLTDAVGDASPRCAPPAP